MYYNGENKIIFLIFCLIRWSGQFCQYTVMTWWKFIPTALSCFIPSPWKSIVMRYMPPYIGKIIKDNANFFTSCQRETFAAFHLIKFNHFHAVEFFMFLCVLHSFTSSSSAHSSHNFTIRLILRHSRERHANAKLSSVWNMCTVEWWQNVRARVNEALRKQLEKWLLFHYFSLIPSTGANWKI